MNCNHVAIEMISFALEPTLIIIAAMVADDLCMYIRKFFLQLKADKVFA